MWTSRKVPRGTSRHATWHHPGSTMCQVRVDGMTTSVDRWDNQWAPRGPISRRHVASSKRPILTHERISFFKKMAGPPNLADHANFNSKLEGLLDKHAKVSRRPNILQYIYIYIYVQTTHQNGVWWDSTPEPPRCPSLNESAHNQCTTGTSWYIRPWILFKRCNPPRARGEARTIRTCGHGFRDKTVIIAGCRGHKNRDKILLGPGSARVGSERGDSHFWVIRCHKFSGDVCFLI
jgi:hypothetical protein